jgi:hypothetical protein
MLLDTNYHRLFYQLGIRVGVSRLLPGSVGEDPRRQLLVRTADASDRTTAAIVREAYQTLSSLEQRAPQAVNFVVSYPAVSTWLLSTATHLYRGRISVAQSARLAAVAAAAAVRAAVTETIDIPVQSRVDGIVQLPSLGTGRLPPGPVRLSTSPDVVPLAAADKHIEVPLRTGPAGLVCADCPRNTRVFDWTCWSTGGSRAGWGARWSLAGTNWTRESSLTGRRCWPRVGDYSCPTTAPWPPKWPRFTACSCRWQHPPLTEPARRRVKHSDALPCRCRPIRGRPHSSWRTRFSMPNSWCLPSFFLWYTTQLGRRSIRLGAEIRALH